jgi:putative oxidoreductase
VRTARAKSAIEPTEGVMTSIAANFNLFDEFNILRLICGLFLIPHCYAKFYVPAALKFWVAAGFKPPKPWMYFAGAIEALLAMALIFGMFVTLAGAIATLHLLVAAVAVHRLTGKYLWNIGGYEFCLFWAICCLVVAMHSYRAGGVWH